MQAPWGVSHICTNGKNECFNVTYVDMASNKECDEAREERLDHDQKTKRARLTSKEKETNEATLVELEGRSFGMSMLSHVGQCMCTFYSSYYCTAVTIL